MSSFFLAAAFFCAGGAFGAILTGVACAAHRQRAEIAEAEARHLRTWGYGAEWPLGRIQSLVADCAQQPVDRVSVVLEVLRAFPSIARGLTRHPTNPEQLADTVAARRWAKLVP